MKIALLIGHFPPGAFGGAELQAEQWAARLSRHHEVTVITRRDPPTQPESEERDGFRVVRLPVSRIPVWRTVADLLAIEQTVRSLSPRPELLLCFQTFISGLAGARLQQAIGVPAVIWIRGEAEYRFEQSRISRWVGPWAWSHAQAVLVQSEQNRSDLLRALATSHAGIVRSLQGRVHVIGNGVDLPARPADADAGTGALSVGRLIADKGMDLVIDAAAEAGIPLTIAGEGPLRAELESHARARGADCRFTGFVGREALRTLYAECGFVVLAARRGEGLPNVLLEAMAHGRPVIATPCAGTRDWIADGVEGRLVPAGDGQALLAAMRHLHAFPEVARRMGAAARARAESSSWDHWLRVFESGLVEWTAPGSRRSH